jgi:predicted transposase/invertase (TIGR01784 family)
MIEECNPQISKAVLKLRELSSDERARDLYERREKARRDMVSREKQAREEGRFEGLREGELRGHLAVAKNMLANGESVEKIAGYTGLTLEEVRNLHNAQ